MRAETLAKIQKWIDTAEGEIDREKLIRTICLKIGATRKKAEEYLEILGYGEDLSL